MSTLAKLKEIIREELNLLNATPAKGKSNNMITLKSIIEGARYVRKPLKESHMSNIDLMANEAKNFKDFVRQFYAEYKDFPKDKATGIWLKDIYDNRSGLDEAINLSADIVGKTVFSDGKGKLFFGYYKKDNSVHFVDYKTWAKLPLSDLSSGHNNKIRVINSILKNQKQFNKKVDYNMWTKQILAPSFQEKMDYFIKNGWISNISKAGIKEGVESLKEANNNDTYFSTASEAVMYARTQAEKKGFEIDENDWNSQITMGGRYSRTRPGIGKTHSFSVGLLKGGKPQRKSLNISLYGMESGKFELTYYIN
jgi:hypothetical protein